VTPDAERQLHQTKQTPRYCPMCDVWVPASQVDCKACGMRTEKPERRTMADVWAEQDDREYEEGRREW